MSLRISSALGLAAVLAGCSAADSPPPPGDTIDCAIGADADFASVCVLERAGENFVLHHPDGGFRRLSRDPATGALAPRDGADVLVPQLDDADTLSFALGADRYRIPLSLIDPPAAPQ